MSPVLFWFVIVWVALGAIAVTLMRRRGHDTFSWAIVFLFLGPIAVPIAISSERHHPAEPPRPLPPGDLDLLVFHDGTPDAHAALESALRLIGPRLTSVTLAAAVDLEAPVTVRGRETQREAQEQLDRLAADVGMLTSAPVATVILFGEPVAALQHFAVENEFELIVAGSRVGMSGHTRRTVPVLVGPAL